MEEFESPPLWVLVITYYNFMVMTVFGYFREVLRRYNIEQNCLARELPKVRDFPVLYDSFAGFYTRNIYMRVRDVFNRPIQSVPGSTFELMDRVTPDSNWSFTLTGRKSEAINLGSYNYLGFAENSGACADGAIRVTHEQGCSLSSSRAEFGTSSVHHELEEKWSRFLGVEETISFGMGFATNSMNIPALVGAGSLIISDELNHTSIVLGCRLSGAKIKVYRHNDMIHLEEILRRSIVMGQDRTCRPYKKVLIIVEGIYSMEGSIVNLERIIELKKKYRAYLYLDEAHSIGALGSRGRGVVEHTGCDIRDVDVMMGTFTKSFGAGGGYISGSHAVISYLRKASHAHTYATSMSPGVAQQVIEALEQIQGAGIDRIRQLKENSKYFRHRLKQMGFIVFGNESSPVVPMMIYVPAKLAAFSRLMTEAGIAVVVVGFPATPINASRVRFCLSASHSREQLEKVLDEVDRIGTLLMLKHSNNLDRLNLK